MISSSNITLRHQSTPGFIDTTSFPQTNMIGSYGLKQPSEPWLTHTLSEDKAQLHRQQHMAVTLRSIFKSFLRNGTTTPWCLPRFIKSIRLMAFLKPAKLHKPNAWFVAKWWWHRNAPVICGLTRRTVATKESKDSSETAPTKARFCPSPRILTPRFAPTSSDEQLQLAVITKCNTTTVYYHTHLSENNSAMCQWVQDLISKSAPPNYFNVFTDPHPTSSWASALFLRMASTFATSDYHRLPTKQVCHFHFVQPLTFIR